MVVSFLRSIGRFTLGDWTVLVLSTIGYALIAYYLPRSHFLPLLATYSLLFAAYLILVRKSKRSREKLLGLIAISLLFRLIFIPATPSLSDDYKRYMWDGHLLHHGINPYQQQPSAVADEVENLNQDWKALVLTKDYHSVYPPLMQACLFVAAAFQSDITKIIALRVLILLFELGTVVLLLRLLPLFNLPSHLTLFYSLNPLVIVEFAGNLHFEAAMIFFTLLAVYLWKKGKATTSGVALSGAILSKLIPIVFLPAFVSIPIRKKHILLASTSVVVSLIGFAFIGWQGVLNMTESLRLYFTTFEFNGSVYYLIRWIGYQIKGYNVIQHMAPYLTAATALLALGLTARQLIRPFKTPFAYITLFLTGYYLLATTVNPWYIAPILAFGIFYKKVFPIAWSFAAFLSYHAYDGTTFHEHTWVLLFEYGIVISTLIYDFTIQPRTHGHP